MVPATMSDHLDVLVNGLVGGRVLTLREPFAPGLWAEAGAMRIPRSHVLTHALIDRYALPTQPFTMDNPQTYCFFGGQRVRHGEAGNDPTQLGFETAPHERVAPGRCVARDCGRVRPVLRA